ncbi:unnamed protein product, partial [Staurois parvus]
MIRTSHRGPVQRLVFHCVRRTQRAADRGAVLLSGSAHKQGVRLETSTRPCTATVWPFIYNGRTGGG